MALSDELAKLQELQRSGDTGALKVANPKPAAWSPPVEGAKPRQKRGAGDKNPAQ